MKGECSTDNKYGYYLNSKNSRKLVKCDDTGCAEEKQNSNLGYYLDGTAVTDSDTKKLIRCTSTGCTYYTNSIPGFYLNAAYPTDTKNLIKCTQEKCRNYVVNSSGFYLSSEYSSRLVKCDDNGCAVESNTSNYGYYLNAEAITDTQSKKLIQCTSDKGCSSVNESSNPSVGYIDASDNTKVIICTSSGCASNSGNTIPGSGYIDATDSKKIITCNNSNGTCTSNTGNMNAGGGYVYGADNKKIITCTSNGCTSTNVIDAGDIIHYYLNLGSDMEFNKLIECSTTTGCSTKEALDKDGYYIYVGGSNTSINSLIHCTNKSNCEGPSTITVSSNDYKYYLNNGYDKKTKPLIECTSNGCSITAAATTEGYYLCGEAAGLSRALIQCTNSSNCKDPMTISFPASYSSSINYYLNNGGDKGSKRIIQCTTSGCTTNSASVGNYLSAGIIINCSKANTCSVIGKAKGYYKNSATYVSKKSKALIKCEVDNSCAEIDGTNGYYINGAVLDSFTNALIQCSDNGCTEVTGVEDLYLENNGKTSFSLDALILCKNNQCISTPGELGIVNKIEFF